MSKYKLDDEVWVMFGNGDKIGYVPARGWIVGKTIGHNATGQKQYLVEVAPGISGFYNAEQMFPNEKSLFTHLKNNRIDR